VAGAAAELEPSLRDAVVRLPSALRSFDQHPADVAELVRRFAATCSSRDAPVLAVAFGRRAPTWPRSPQPP
jgi:hypothetical protein